MLNSMANTENELMIFLCVYDRVSVHTQFLCAYNWARRTLITQSRNLFTLKQQLALRVMYILCS